MWCVQHNKQQEVTANPCPTDTSRRTCKEACKAASSVCWRHVLACSTHLLCRPHTTADTLHQPNSLCRVQHPNSWGPAHECTPLRLHRTASGHKHIGPVEWHWCQSKPHNLPNQRLSCCVQREDRHEGFIYSTLMACCECVTASITARM